LTVADERYCFAIDRRYGDVEAAPLMCAGLIGYRTLRMAGDAQCLGIYGFGAAAHIVAQVARHQGRRVFAFTAPAMWRRRILPARSAPSGPAIR
jgi:propanol-preferring alcohol dehydrogenase